MCINHQKCVFCSQNRTIPCWLLPWLPFLEPRLMLAGNSLETQWVFWVFFGMFVGLKQVFPYDGVIQKNLKIFSHNLHWWWEKLWSFSIKLPLSQKIVRYIYYLTNWRMLHHMYDPSGTAICDAPHWFSKAPSFSDRNYQLSVKKKFWSTGPRSFLSPMSV